MSLDVPLQVAICLAFVFAMFSLLVSAVQELIASVTKLRARTFVEGLRQLLGPSQDGDAQPGKSVATSNANARQGWSEIRTITGSVAGSPLFQDVLKHPLIQAGSTRGIPSYASAGSFALAVLDHLNNKELQLDKARIETALTSLPACDAKDALRALWAKANGSVDAFQAEIETWFDDAMDRVSGVYKRWSQAIALVLGFLLSAALNVDTLRVSEGLWRDPALRARIEAGAEAHLAAARGASDRTGRQQEQLAADKEFDKLGLPVGWGAGAADRFTSAWPLVLLGWIITAVASSFGAPFWFDALQRFANLRGAGPKPKRSDSS